MTPAIAIRDLSVAFAGRPVLRGLNLDIAAGGPTVLVGRSGAGKTTLLRAINRLNECLPGCASSGSVRLHLADGDLEAYAPDTDPEALRRRVGMVFQSPHVLPVSVARNFALPLRLTTGATEAEIQRRTRQALGEVRLWDEVKDRLQAPAASLSGGQQQRLCLARALALDPEILLLDEPTASLDYQATRGIETLLRELAGRYTLVVVSHSLNQARRLARRLLVLRRGAEVEAVDAESLADGDRLLSLMDERF